MEPIDLPARLGAAAAEPSPANMRALFETFLKAGVLVPVSPPSPAQAASGELGLVVLRGRDGRSALPVFSDKESFEGSGAAAYAAELTGRAALEKARAMGLDLILNPGRQPSIALGPQDIAALLEGRLEQLAGAAAGKPAGGPALAFIKPDYAPKQSTLDWFAQRCRARPEILAVYIVGVEIDAQPAVMALLWRLGPESAALAADHAHQRALAELFEPAINGLGVEKIAPAIEPMHEALEKAGIVLYRRA
jgi:hypothetical protein